MLTRLALPRADQRLGACLRLPSLTSTSSSVLSDVPKTTVFLSQLSLGNTCAAGRVAAPFCCKAFHASAHSRSRHIMAVLPSLPGLTTVVRTASGPLSEYPDPDADDRNKTHTSCYIEAQSGQSFEVEWTFRDGSVFALCQCVEVEIHLDGNYAQSTVVEAHDRHRTPTMSWKGVRVVDDAGHNVRLFTFAELTTGTLQAQLQITSSADIPYIVEDLNTGSQTVKQLKHLGEIEVRWIRARHLSVEPATKQNSTSNYKSVVDSGEIAEKKLKGRAISHQAT